MRRPLRIAVVMTLGDPAGIGPEILLQTLLRIATGRDGVARKLARCLTGGELSLKVVGSVDVLKQVYAKMPRAKKEAGTLSFLKDELRINSRHTVALLGLGAFARAQKAHDILPGKPSVASGEHALAALKQGCELLKAGGGDVLVTCPLSKEIVRLCAKSFVGHTEYLEDFFCRQSPAVSMGFISAAFKLILITRHVALREVGDALTRQRIRLSLEHACELIALTGKRRRGRSRHSTEQEEGYPVAVLAVNPHGGEGGMFGNEEDRLRMEIARMQKEKRHLPWGEKILWEGPLSADTAFMKVGTRRRYGLVVAAYHDQGLIPLKTQAGFKAVNVTLGLPFVRTSVDHGTGFDIAGSYQSDETSLLVALWEGFHLEQRSRVLGLRESGHTYV